MLNLNPMAYFEKSVKDFFLGLLHKIKNKKETTLHIVCISYMAININLLS